MVNKFLVDYAVLCISWANTSLFVNPGTLPTLDLPIKGHPSSRELFFDVILLSNYVWKGETIKSIPYYMTDIIYKTINPLHLKKSQIIQNTNILMFQVIFLFSEWTLIKQIKVSPTTVCSWEKHIFEKELPGGMGNFPLPGVWW